MRPIHLVREMKKYGHIDVANAMYAVGYHWPNPRHRPANIDRMVVGIPRPDLVRILAELRRSA